MYSYFYLINSAKDFLAKCSNELVKCNSLHFTWHNFVQNGFIIYDEFDRDTKLWGWQVRKVDTHCGKKDEMKYIILIAVLYFTT